MILSRHGGNIRAICEELGLSLEDVIDFSVSINPLGPPPDLKNSVAAALDKVQHYPDTDCTHLRRKIAAAYGIGVSNTLVGNGSTELLYLIPQSLKPKTVLIPQPAYSDYVKASITSGADVKEILLNECSRREESFRVDFDRLNDNLSGVDIVFLGNPNNPTGMTLLKDDIIHIAANNPDVVFVLDESYLDFVEQYERHTLLGSQIWPNIIVVKSLTKLYAIPGLRLGFLTASDDMVRKLEEVKQAWSVNSIALEVGESIFTENPFGIDEGGSAEPEFPKSKPEDSTYAQKTRSYISEQRVKLQSGLEKLRGLKPFPSDANFILVKVERDDINATALRDTLIPEGIIIRDCSNFQGLSDKFFRVAVRTEAENKKLLKSLGQVLGWKHPVATPSHYPAIQKPKVLMLQGTSSNVGKSVLAAAFCRIFLQDGYRVAPFKSQNMALNSFVTRDGKEMGRAQVVQAQACRLEPDVRMNPILLKPSSDTGSQVIVMGKPVGNMSAEKYIEFKEKAFDAATQAFSELAQENEIIVIEGAGSPAEINLKHHDIVNMRLAEYTGAKVLLVGDIDHGGVFASFIGTMELLTPQETKLVKGFLINKFRGRAELLDPALRFMEKRTGRAVLGVIPYLTNLRLPDEDSVEFKNTRRHTSSAYDAPIHKDASVRSAHVNASAPQDKVTIAIIDLPHISNFTDFDALALEPDVELKIVRESEAIGTVDAVILPGSKNVISDLRYLRSRGYAEEIAHLAQSGCSVVGICGGFQMLGKEISDPHGIESAHNSIESLGIVNVMTTLAEKKTLKQVEAIHLQSQLKVRGYEIHHGETTGDGHTAVFSMSDGRLDGAQTNEGRIWGTYIHGVFDEDLFRRWFINTIRQRKGLPPLEGIQTTYNLEKSLDEFASVIRESVDMEKIYSIVAGSF